MSVLEMTDAMDEARRRAPRTLRRADAGPPGSWPTARRCLTSALVAMLAFVAACGGDGARGGDSTNAPAAQVGSGSSGCATTAIEATGVGVVRLGAAIRAIDACPTRDTAWSIEGIPERGRIVTIGGARVVAVTGDDTVVSRVIVRDSTLRTAAGVGVGSTVAQLQRAYGDYCAFPAEVGGTVAIFPNLSGVSFVTDAQLPRTGPLESPTLPADARVTEVVVHGSVVRCVPARQAE